MKFVSALFAAAIALAGSSAFAQAKDVFACQVPVQNGSVQVTLNLSAYFETSQDFVVVDVNDKGTAFQMFNELKPGELNASIQQGEVGFLLAEANVGEDAGVLRNAGFIMLSKGQNGGFEGLLSARGNIYPLACTLK